jgi:GGDEF domain-containing protein
MDESKRIVESYLSLLSGLAESVIAASPAVGTPYGHRLERLRVRLEYDPNADAVEESTDAARTELKDYSHQAAIYVDRHGAELRRATEVLLDSVRMLSQKQDFYCARLRQFSNQMETTPYPTDPEHLADIVSMQATGLRNCIDSLSHDWQSLLTRMKVELVEAERRIAEAETTDPITGLMNHREMERQVELHRASGEPGTLLLFTIGLGLPDDVIQQVASRLMGQFRHADRVSRWSGNEFLVLFRGSPEIAESRAEEIVAWVGGRYLADNGDQAEVQVSGGLVQHEAALA